MEGIHILSETLIMPFAGMGLFFGFIFAIGVVVSLICSVIFTIHKDRWRNPTVILFIVCLIMSTYCFRIANSKSIYTLYQVTIEDSVGFNEFNERYEIIKQDGEIYTVKEK